MSDDPCDPEQLVFVPFESNFIETSTKDFCLLRGTAALFTIVVDSPDFASVPRYAGSYGTVQYYSCIAAIDGTADAPVNSGHVRSSPSTEQSILTHPVPAAGTVRVASTSRNPYRVHLYHLWYSYSYE